MSRKVYFKNLVGGFEITHQAFEIRVQQTTLGPGILGIELDLLEYNVDFTGGKTIAYQFSIAPLPHPVRIDVRRVQCKPQGLWEKADFTMAEEKSFIIEGSSHVYLFAFLDSISS